MANKPLPVSFRVDPDLYAQLKETAHEENRTATGQLEHILKRWFRLPTGESRQADMQALSDAGLAAYRANAPRVRGPNPSEIIAEASTAGHGALRAHEKIAADSK